MDEFGYHKDNAKQIFEKYDIAVEKDRIIVTVPLDWISSFQGKLDDMMKWLDIKYTDIDQEFAIEIL